MNDSCILCGNISVILLEIKGHTRDDIIELFGARNETCIKENQLICKPCQKMLEKLAQLKRRLRYLILRPSDDRKPVDLTHIWKLFASFQLDKDDKEKRSIPTPNPSLLFTVSDCEEVAENNSKRKSKKRGHGWTKRKRSSSAASVTSRRSASGSTRANSRGSRCTDNYTPFSSLSGFSNFESSRPNTPYSNISRVTGATKRSQRRAASIKVVNDDYHETKDDIDSNKLYCPFKRCSLYYISLDKLNYHIKVHHKSAELFNCTECTASFCLKEHLQIHSKIHDFSPFFCLMCAEPQENRVKLQNHLDQHMNFSAPCTYCDKYFLSETQLRAHHKKEHARARSQEVVKQKKLIVMKMVFKKDNFESNNNEDLSMDKESIDINQVNEPVNTNPQTEPEPVTNNSTLQCFTGKEYNVYVLPQIPTELDITFENFNLENFEFYTGEGYEATDDESHMDTERDPENLTTEDDNGNLRSEMDSIIAENGSDIDRNEEIETILSGDAQEMQGNNCSNSDDDSTTRKPLVNGFSDSNETEVMDVGNGEENRTSPERPS